MRAHGQRAFHRPRRTDPLVRYRRRHCEAGIPGMKVAQAGKAVAAARKALALQAAEGNDPRRDPEVNRKRAVAECPKGIGATVNGSESVVRRNATRHGSGARCYQSLTPIRLARSLRRRDYRSRPARASGQVRECRFQALAGATATARRGGTPLDTKRKSNGDPARLGPAGLGASDRHSRVSLYRYRGVHAAVGIAPRGHGRCGEKPRCALTQSDE